MNGLVSLPVVIPLIAAAVLVGTVAVSRRRFVDAWSTGCAIVVTVLLAVVLVRSGEKGMLVHWFGGWEPRDGVALGISFAVDPFGAGLALFVGFLFVMAFVFSWRYFTVIGPLFHALMLVFLAAAVGFSLTGDLFNLFVFFELLSVSAYALTAYDIEEEGPLQGALNFAVTNSIGAALVLTGIALLYARTGALNMAQMGEALAGSGADALTTGAFTLLVVGFLVKAAVVPFHFWLADAYSVAPTPVCLLLSAAVSELGLYALARVYWTVFSGALDGSEDAIRAVLVCAGTLTAVVGAVMCFAQRHLRRMLAFATISHVGLFLIGIALLEPGGLSGTAVYVLADGAVKASLFVCVGVIGHRYASVDEHTLFGRGRDLPITAGLMALGGLALASLPPFGPFLGKALIEESATELGYAWIAVPFVFASAVTGAAVLRACGRIFLGWGRQVEHGSDPFAAPTGEADPEIEYPRDAVPQTMTIPTIVLLAVGLGIGLVPGLPDHFLAAAERFQDRPGYVASVLQGRAAAQAGPADAHGPGAIDFLYASLSMAGALGLAALALTRGRVRDALRPGAAGAADRALQGLRGLHSGHVGDYVTWLVVGTAVLGGLFAATL
jgi:multicomponent Na+:H+ antiporter subunit D